MQRGVHYQQSTPNRCYEYLMSTCPLHKFQDTLLLVSSFFKIICFIVFLTCAHHVPRDNTIGNFTCKRSLVIVSLKMGWLGTTLKIYRVCFVGNRLFYFRKKHIWTQAQRRAAAGRSRHKSHWVIQYLGSYLPTRCPKWIFIIPIVLVEKKHTKLISHTPW